MAILLDPFNIGLRHVIAKICRKNIFRHVNAIPI
jgi:hypothetical protein